jgi:TetR/AcrR family transcriptional regulator
MASNSKKTAARTISRNTGRLTTRSGEENINRILNAALKKFSTHGFRGTRIDQVAEAAGMSRTRMLYYFPSKKKLYLAILERTLEQWLEPLRGFDEATDPRQALTDYISRKLAMSATDPMASRLFAMEMLQGAPHTKRILQGPLTELVREKSAVIRRWMEAGHLKPMEPYHLIFAIWSTTQHYADFSVQVHALTGQSLKDSEFFEQTQSTLVQILLNGVLR